CATSVVLPAPFGPMIACSSPCCTCRSIAALAITPPKRLLSPSVASRMSAMACRRRSFRKAQHATFTDHNQEHKADTQTGAPINGPSRDNPFQQQVEDRTDDWAHERAHAAGDDH